MADHQATAVTDEHDDDVEALPLPPAASPMPPPATSLMSAASSVPSAESSAPAPAPEVDTVAAEPADHTADHTADHPADHTADHPADHAADVAPLEDQHMDHDMQDEPDHVSCKTSELCHVSIKTSEPIGKGAIQ